MKIAIIDYKAGNAPSVKHAINHMGHKAVFARCALDIADATHIILPGVGSAKATMDSLAEMELIPALEEAVLRRKVNFLGICVGLQILFEHSEEGNTRCLGWLKGRVLKFGGKSYPQGENCPQGESYPQGENLRVPQMGWNKVTLPHHSDYFYFVNSYYAKPENPKDIWGTADYGGVFAAAVRCGNIFATQFHAEKSGEAGFALLREFLGEGCGTC